MKKGGVDGGDKMTISRTQGQEGKRHECKVNEQGFFFRVLREKFAKLALLLLLIFSLVDVVLICLKVEKGEGGGRGGAGEAVLEGAEDGGKGPSSKQRLEARWWPANE